MSYERLSSSVGEGANFHETWPKGCEQAVAVGGGRWAVGSLDRPQLQGDPLADADAHGGKSPAGFPPVHLHHRCPDQAGPGHPGGVAEGDGSAVGIDELGVVGNPSSRRQARD